MRPAGDALAVDERASLSEHAHHEHVPVAKIVQGAFKPVALDNAADLLGEYFCAPGRFEGALLGCGLAISARRGADKARLRKVCVKRWPVYPVLRLTCESVQEERGRTLKMPTIQSVISEKFPILPIYEPRVTSYGNPPRKVPALGPYHGSRA